MTWACQKLYRQVSKQEGFLPFPSGCDSLSLAHWRTTALAVMDSDPHAELIIQSAPGSREMNLRQGRRQISLDRYGRVTMYEEISLSMMIKREGRPAAKHSSSLPEARGSSVRMVRDIMRLSEMLTELLLMFGPPSPFKHIVFAQCSSPVLYYFSCCRCCHKAAGLEITQTLQQHYFITNITSNKVPGTSGAQQWQ